MGQQLFGKETDATMTAPVGIVLGQSWCPVACQTHVSCGHQNGKMANKNVHVSPSSIWYLHTAINIDKNCDMIQKN